MSRSKSPNVAPSPALWSEDAEQAVLAAMLMDAAALASALAGPASLTPPDFGSRAHGHLFAAMRDLHAAGSAVDPLTLLESLRASGLLDACGGGEYVAFLSDAVPTAANVAHHAAIVRRLAEKRRLAETLDAYRAEAVAPESEPAETAAALAAELLPAAAAGHRGGFVAMRDLTRDAVDEVIRRAHGETPAGLPLGFPELDEACGGAEPGDLVTLVMVSGHGKSALQLAMLARVADGGACACYVSAEMAARQLTLRMLASAARVPFWRLRRGDLTGDEWPRLGHAQMWLNTTAVFVDDAATPDVDAVCAKVRALKAQHPALSHAVVDYLQLLTAKGAGDGRGGEAVRAERIEYGANRLKGLAKELGIVVVASAQPDAKLIERRSGEPMPRLADVAWGQGIRNASDTVVCGYRPGLYEPVPDGEGRFSVEKSRASGKAAFALGWDGPTMTYRSLRSTEGTARSLYVA